MGLKRVQAAVAADYEWCEKKQILQNAVPTDRKDTLDPILWHIEKNICKGHANLSQFAKAVMARIAQNPERKQDVLLDDKRLDQRVANFLKAFRDAVGQSIGSTFSSGVFIMRVE